MQQLTLLRSQGRQIGPKFLRSLMKREVKKISVDPSASSSRKTAAQAFREGSSWLFRFAKWHQTTLRRKTNNKKAPISERANKIKHWMAIFRLWLRSFHDKHGHCETESIFPAECRWSLDQVPAGLYNPRSTREVHTRRKVPIECTSLPMALSTPMGSVHSKSSFATESTLRFPAMANRDCACVVEAQDNESRPKRRNNITPMS